MQPTPRHAAWLRFSTEGENQTLGPRKKKYSFDLPNPQLDTHASITTQQFSVPHSASCCGWNIMEGTHCYNASSCDTSSLLGIYFFGDFCSGRLWGLQPENGSWAMQELLDTTYNISTFGEYETGALFLADYGGGSVRRLVEGD